MGFVSRGPSGVVENVFVGRRSLMPPAERSGRRDMRTGAKYTLAENCH